MKPDVTADLLRHFADIACALGQVERSADIITGEPASSLPDTAEDLAALLDCRGGWRNIEDAIRTLEEGVRAQTTDLTTPELPEGWRWGGWLDPTASGGMLFTARACGAAFVQLSVDGGGGIQWSSNLYAPPAVYAALFARAGLNP